MIIDANDNLIDLEDTKVHLMTPGQFRPIFNSKNKIQNDSLRLIPLALPSSLLWLMNHPRQTHWPNEARSPKGIFETLLGGQGGMDDLSQHHLRMRQGAKILGLNTVPSLLNWQRRYERLLGVLRYKKSLRSGLYRVRMLLWQEARKVHSALMICDYDSPKRSKLIKGFSCCVFKTSWPAQNKYCQVKSLDYAFFSNWQQRAKRLGYDEALLLNERNQLMEFSRGNIFFRRNNTWFTPHVDTGCLAGVMRANFITNAKQEGFSVKAGVWAVDDLLGVDEIRLTNSLLGVVPINIKQSDFKPRR